MHTCAVNAVVATALPLRVSLRMSPRAHLSMGPLRCTPTTSPHCATDRGVWCIWMLSTCKRASRRRRKELQEGAAAAATISNAVAAVVIGTTNATGRSSKQAQHTHTHLVAGVCEAHAERHADAQQPGQHAHEQHHAHAAHVHLVEHAGAHRLFAVLLQRADALHGGQQRRALVPVPRHDE